MTTIVELWRKRQAILKAETIFTVKHEIARHDKDGRIKWWDLNEEDEKRSFQMSDLAEAAEWRIVRQTPGTMRDILIQLRALSELCLRMRRHDKNIEGRVGWHLARMADALAKMNQM